jgi:hypothetical protein
LSRNLVEPGHNAAQTGKSMASLMFNQGLEGEPDQRANLLHTGEFPGGANQFIVERDGYRHKASVNLPDVVIIRPFDFS